MPTWDQRLPFLGSHGREQIKRRFMGCAPVVAQTLGIPVENVYKAKPLGCGNYGCTYLVDGLPADRSVLKVTSDNLEAHIVNQFLSYPGDMPPDGIVRYHGIWRLGKCGILPRMKWLTWKTQGRHPQYGYPTPGQTVRYEGEGAPYRPAWVIQREELGDVLPELKKRGVGKKKLADALDGLWRYVRKLQVQSGLRKQMAGEGYIYQNAPSYEDLEKDLKAVHALALLEAEEWLIERSIKFEDFQKIANLGWRDGTGVVIRDIGFADTTTSVEPATVLDGLGTFHRFTRGY